jgi:hypothetical protein
VPGRLKQFIRLGKTDVGAAAQGIGVPRRKTGGSPDSFICLIASRSTSAELKIGALICRRFCAAIDPRSLQAVAAHQHRRLTLAPMS